MKDHAPRNAIWRKLIIIASATATLLAYLAAPSIGSMMCFIIALSLLTVVALTN